ncbi:MAG: hypothetical protein N2234_06725, partial [Planctomycetota bacterium]|nr:hypothetical protein [Planctomycetota bacterium]
MEWVPEKETPRYVPPEVRRKVKQRGLLKFIVAVAEMGIGVALYSLLGTLALPRTLSGLENSPDGVRTTGTVMRGELRKDISFNGVHPYEIEYRFVDK